MACTIENIAAIKVGGATPKRGTDSPPYLPVLEENPHSRRCNKPISKLPSKLVAGKLAACDAFSDRNYTRLRNHPNRGIVFALVAGLCTGCTTIFNPYLDSTPLNRGALCEQADTNQTKQPLDNTNPNQPKQKQALDKTTPDCSAVDRFRAIRSGVIAVQQQAQDGYNERAELNSVSSALAFPAIGILLYRGVTVDTANGRNALLQGSLAVGAAYEARNALLTGSPESIYILCEARLACVVDEAAKYRLALPIGESKDKCDKTAADLGSRADTLAGLKGLERTYVAPRDSLVTKVRAAVTAYNTTDATLWTAADHMQAAARKIVSDTNVQLKTPSISPATATPLMKSEMALFAPASQVPELPPSGKPMSAGEDKAVKAINDLTIQINDFGSKCLRPQPASPAAFDACTTYSPAAPAPPTITTTLPSNEVTLNPKDTLTFTATSVPTGTPWATFFGDASIAQQALGQLQLITLSPTQTQVSLTYANAVSADTKVVLSLATLGASGNATPITLTLKAAQAAQAPAVTTGVWGKVRADPEVMGKLGLGEGSSDDAVEKNLQGKWRELCDAASRLPTNKQLLKDEFLAALKSSAAPDSNQGFCEGGQE